MTDVRVYLKGKKVKKVVLEGHSGYAPIGKDIVCSAISSIVACSINAILCLGGKVKYEDDSGYVVIETEDESRNTHLLLKNMISLLEELSEDYEENIKITIDNLDDWHKL